MIKVFNTHTGKIFVDTQRELEFLTVGDYGKENNIKASFLGLNKEINGVKHKEVHLEDKWVATISTQKGCLMKCNFCDCPKYGFRGNCSIWDLEYELETILQYGVSQGVKHTKRFNLHFARMGEPTFNKNVLSFAQNNVKNVVHNYISADTIHPVVSTMMPNKNIFLEDYLNQWCYIKNETYHGEAGLQLSIQSTDDEQRNFQFNNRALPLKEISMICAKLPKPKGRKYTLNFAVTADTILDANVLNDLFDKNDFIVKITPIHKTNTALENNFDVGTSYVDFDVYRQFEQPLVNLGWDVIVFVPSKEEDEDRITCGNALITEMKGE